MLKKGHIAIGLILIILLSGITTGASSIKKSNKLVNNKNLNYSLNNPDIIFVDDDREPPWYNETHVKTIQEGIENASHYDTVFVYNGSYYENVFIHKRIKLIGEDKQTTIIDGSRKGHVVSILINGVELSGFTIRNSNWKIFEDNTGIRIASFDNIIHNNIIINNLQGILILMGSNNSIFNNKIIDNNHPILPRQGIGVSIINANNNYIGNNIIERNSNGIILSSSEENIISNNSIKLCKCGIGIQKGFNSENISSRNIIIGNKLLLNKVGINIYESRENEIKNNDFRLNRKGVFITNSVKNKIIKNNFILNLRHAQFQFEERTHIDNIWDQNYWKRPRILPFPIFGIKTIVIPLIHTSVKLRVIKLDWHPALKPYDI